MSEWIVTPSAIKERQVDVVVVGGGTSGAIAAVAAARNGADTMVVEQKGYFGGIAVEGGTALHSFYNLWQAFPGQEKRQLIRGIPQELIERLVRVGGCSGHVPMELGFNYDSVCTVIDVEITKYILHQMVEEAGVRQALNTVIVDVQRNGDRVESILLSSHGHLERVYAKNFIDATGFGDLCALAGAQYTEPNDHSVANSIGVGGVDVEAYANFFREKGALVQYARGVRDGKEGRAIRVQGNFAKALPELAEEARAIGMASVITTLHDGYFMFLKLNFKTPASPADPETLSQAELELRRRQQRAVELFRKYIPGCSKAFIARSSPSVCIRRGRCITCDYDMSLDDILSARRFEDELYLYGFHDCAPRLQIRDGGWYGLPYRAIRVQGIGNLYAVGMMITSNWEAHMSTRNTVSCMAMGQAAGTAAALCASKTGGDIRSLDYGDLRDALLRGGVYLGEDLD